MFEASHLHKLQERALKLQALAEQDTELTPEEREFVEDTLKKILASKKKEVVEFEHLHRKERATSPHIEEYLKQLTKRLFCFCIEAIEMIEKEFLPRTQSVQGKVFFYKVKGDFFRYSAEFLKKADSHYNLVLQEGLNAYMMGYEMARRELPCEDAVYLHLCLNFSVFYYAVAKDIPKACKLISKVLKELERNRETIVDEIWKSVQPTVCLLTNNLRLWLSELEEDQ